MSSIDASSSDTSVSLILSSNDGTNSDIRIMKMQKLFYSSWLGKFISVLVGSRDKIFDWCVTINKGICWMIILITRSPPQINE